MYNTFIDFMGRAFAWVTPDLFIFVAIGAFVAISWSWWICKKITWTIALLFVGFAGVVIIGLGLAIYAWLLPLLGIILAVLFSRGCCQKCCKDDCGEKKHNVTKPKKQKKEKVVKTKKMNEKQVAKVAMEENEKQLKELKAATQEYQAVARHNVKYTEQKPVVIEEPVVVQPLVISDVKKEVDAKEKKEVKVAYTPKEVTVTQKGPATIVESKEGLAVQEKKEIVTENKTVQSSQTVVTQKSTTQSYQVNRSERRASADEQYVIRRENAKQIAEKEKRIAQRYDENEVKDALNGLQRTLGFNYRRSGEE